MPGNPSGFILFESNLPPANPAVGTQELSIDTTSKALVKTDSSGNQLFLGSTAVANVTLVGKSLGAGTAVTATVTSGVATVTHTSHGYAQNDVIIMAGATSSGTIGDFNQLHVITSVATNTYTFTTTATGTISTPSELFWFSGVNVINPTKIKNITRSSTGNFSLVLTNTQATIYYGICVVGVGGASQDCQTNLRSANPPTTTGFNFLVINNSAATPVDPTNYLYVSLSGIS